MLLIFFKFFVGSVGIVVKLCVIVVVVVSIASSYLLFFAYFITSTRRFVIVCLCNCCCSFVDFLLNIGLKMIFSDFMCWVVVLLMCDSVIVCVSCGVLCGVLNLNFYDVFCCVLLCFVFCVLSVMNVCV